MSVNIKQNPHKIIRKQILFHYSLTKKLKSKPFVRLFAQLGYFQYYKGNKLAHRVHFKKLILC